MWRVYPSYVEANAFVETLREVGLRREIPQSAIIYRRSTHGGNKENAYA